MDTARYIIRYFVNKENTCVVENVPAQEAWKMAVPTEALMATEGSRWHVYMAYPTLQWMRNAQPGDKIKVAYQGPPENPELDTEVIYLEKMYPTSYFQQ
jgi:hypothetical protein